MWNWNLELILLGFPLECRLSQAELDADFFGNRTVILSCCNYFSFLLWTRKFIICINNCGPTNSIFASQYFETAFQKWIWFSRYESAIFALVCSSNRFSLQIAANIVTAPAGLQFLGWNLVVSSALSLPTNLGMNLKVTTPEKNKRGTLCSCLLLCCCQRLQVYLGYFYSKSHQVIQWLPTKQAE